MKPTVKEDFKKLRKKLDGSEAFMSGHQIRKIRTREKQIPSWTLRDKDVQKIILRAFPNMKTNKTARKRAGRWARIIYLYYRSHMTSSQISAELGETINQTKMTLKAIRRVWHGKRADNTALRSPQRPGRPKK
jgi:hypothetical protein